MADIKGSSVGEDNVSALSGAFFFPSPPFRSPLLPSPLLSFFFPFPFSFPFLSSWKIFVWDHSKKGGKSISFALSACCLPPAVQRPGARNTARRRTVLAYGRCAGVQACRRAGAGPPEQGGASTDWPRAGAAHALGKRASTVLNEALCAVPGTGLELSSGVSCPTRPGAGVRASLVHVEALPTPHGPTVHR